MIVIGHNSHIGENNWIYANPDGGVTIGNNVNIAANVYIIDSNHKTKKGELIRTQPMDVGKVFIGNDVWIGANVTIIKNTVLEDGCVVGACALVNKHFDKDSIIGGVPAKLLSFRQ